MIRFPTILALLLVVIDTGYKKALFNQPKQTPAPASADPLRPKILLSWTFIFLLLFVLDQTQLSPVSAGFDYLIIAIIMLNDGYEIAKAL